MRLRDLHRDGLSNVPGGRPVLRLGTLMRLRFVSRSVVTGSVDALAILVFPAQLAALVAVMIMVGIGTFRWDSIRTLRTHLPSSSVVMKFRRAGVAVEVSGPGH